MWHPLEYVAEQSNVDLAALLKFAIDNEARYGIVQDAGSVEVNTWHVDQLIKDFKNQTDTKNG